MLEIAGKQIPTVLEEVLLPTNRCAVLVVDLQNDFCHRDGVFGRAGTDMNVYDAVVTRANALTAAAEKAGALVVYLQNTSLPGLVSDSPAQLRMAWRARPRGDLEFKLFEYTVAGTWGQGLLDTLEVPAGALIVEKHRSSGFVGTSLDVLLRSNGIRTIVVAGCTTEGCVDSTVRDGGFLDYFPVVAEDAVGTPDTELHEAAMLILRSYRADVASVATIASIWAEADQHQS